MEKYDNVFGRAILQARIEANLSLWDLALPTRCHMTNLRQFENGDVQPGIMLALKLVMAVNTPVGSFFNNVAQEAGLKVAVNPDAQSMSQSQLLCTPVKYPAKVRYLFGPFFKTVRVQCMVSQKNVAQIACYHPRSLIKVENGEQEPAVMTALAMVCALGVDVGAFSGRLCQLYLEFHGVE